MSFAAYDPRALPWAGMTDAFGVFIAWRVAFSVFFARSQSRVARSEARLERSAIRSFRSAERTVPLHQRAAPIKDGFVVVTWGLGREEERTGKGKVWRT